MLIYPNNPVKSKTVFLPTLRFSKVRHRTLKILTHSSVEVELNLLLQSSIFPHLLHSMQSLACRDLQKAWETRQIGEPVASYKSQKNILVQFANYFRSFTHSWRKCQELCNSLQVSGSKDMFFLRVSFYDGIPSCLWALRHTILGPIKPSDLILSYIR